MTHTHTYADTWINRCAAADDGPRAERAEREEESGSAATEEKEEREALTH